MEKYKVISDISLILFAILLIFGVLLKSVWLIILSAVPLAIGCVLMTIRRFRK